MDDFDSLVFDASSVAPENGGIPATGIVEFNEVAYLAAFPEIESTIKAGQATSALDHYLRFGRPERRLETTPYLLSLAGDQAERPSHGQLSFNIDTVFMSEAGAVFVVGWSDDRASPLLSVSVIHGTNGWNTRGVARCRRADVEELLGAPGIYAFGFWILHEMETEDPELALGSSQGPIMLRARMEDGRFCQAEVAPKRVTSTELREIVLGHFASLAYLGNREIEASAQLNTGAGAAILTLNRKISHGVTKAAYVIRFGPTRAKFEASFIVCLFGKAEYFFLQNALFSSGQGAENVEFIYVSNSPELAETLQKEARIAERIYGLSVSLVILPDNAGFSAANNVAAQAARSDRLVFINPDVFPRDDAWATQHGRILESRPREETRLFGAPLFYDDGSLMHGGMFFEVDQGLSVKASGIRSTALIRVEHYGKGAPQWSDTYSRSRPVPAVTGAFISADRSWFELLGGFTEDYVFGHYEDADLCLKSLIRGTPVWLQDIRFWHLEGKGSVRRPTHEGGSLVNRWHFTRQWGQLIETSLVGRKPAHPLLNRPASEKEPEPVLESDVKARPQSTPAKKRRSFFPQRHTEPR